MDLLSYFDSYSRFNWDGVTKKRKRQMRTLYKNNSVYKLAVNTLVQDCITDWHIEGLPDSCNPYVVKMNMLWYACACFTKGIRYDNRSYKGIYNVNAVPGGSGLNINYDPGKVFIFSNANGKIAQQIDVYIPGADKGDFLREMTAGEVSGDPKGVLVWDNPTRFPFINYILYYALLITKGYRSLENQLAWLNKMAIITAPEEIVDDINDLLEEMNNEEQYAITSGSFDEVSNQWHDVSVINPGVDGTSLQNVTGIIEWFRSKIRELRGINNNAQMDKKGENLITAEITVNDQYQELRKNAHIDCKNFYFEKAVNPLLGTNMKAVSDINDYENLDDANALLDPSGEDIKSETGEGSK